MLAQALQQVSVRVRHRDDFPAFLSLPADWVCS
jgi:hypothetical protein